MNKSQKKPYYNKYAYYPFLNLWVYTGFGLHMVKIRGQV
jgi:hypothetical protein